MHTMQPMSTLARKVSQAKSVPTANLAASVAVAVAVAVAAEPMVHRKMVSHAPLVASNQTIRIARTPTSRTMQVTSQHRDQLPSVQTMSRQSTRVMPKATT